MEACPKCGVTPCKPVAPSLREQPKPGDLRIAIVGEAPGRDEDKKGEPFVGYSGKLLRSTLTACGLNPDQILFTNVCCCRPTKIVQGKTKDRPPTSEEMALGRIRLMNELREFKPDRILSVGNTAFMGLFNTKTCKITEERGVWHFLNTGPYENVGETNELLWASQVMPTIHPAALLRDAGPFKDFVRDIQNLVRPIPTWDYPETIVCNDREDFKGAWDKCVKRMHDTFSMYRYHCWVDIETNSLSDLDGKILCISISPDPHFAIVIAEEALHDVIYELEAIAKNPNIVWGGHNVKSFDEPFLEAALGFHWPIKRDTMLEHYVIDERLGSQALKGLARSYLGIPDYSKEVKKYLIDDGATFEAIPPPELHKYAGMDTAVTAGISVSVKEEWAEQIAEGFNPQRVYDMLLGFAEVLAKVERNGALLDPEYFKELDRRWTEEIGDISKTEVLPGSMIDQIRQITGRGKLKPRSAKQIAEVLFDDLDLDSVEMTKGGNRATGKKVLAKLKAGLKDKIEKTELARLDSIETEDMESDVLDQDAQTLLLLDLILNARSRAHNRSTYVRGLPLRRHSDGRVRPHLMLHGTATGRLACRNPNLQNVPKHSDISIDIRNGFVASPGKVFLEFDYSTLELRTAAYLSRDPNMIQAFLNDVDIHRVVGAKIFKKPESEVTGDERYQSKFIDFGIIYGREADSIAEQLGCTVKEAERLKNEFLAGFPVLRGWMLETQKFVIEHGYVESFFGRRRRWELITSNNKNAIRREAVNMPVSSMASDINLHALCRAHREIDQKIGTILFPIHDAILMEVDRDRVEEIVPKMLHIMEDVESMGIEPIFPFKAEASIGIRWGSMTEFKTMKKAQKKAGSGFELKDMLARLDQDEFAYINEDGLFYATNAGQGSSSATATGFIITADERHDREAWSAQFTASKDTLEDLHDEAMEEYRSGDTIEIG